MNYKRKYEDLTCTECKEEEMEKKEPSLKSKLKFEAIFKGSIEDKAYIARIFEKKITIREKFIN